MGNLPWVLVAMLAIGFAFVSRDAMSVRADRDALQGQLANARANLVAEQEARQQAREAAQVAQAHADRLAVEAARFDELRNAILEGGYDETNPGSARDALCASGVILCPDTAPGGPN